MIISFIIFFAIIGVFEYIQYRKKRRREDAAVELTISGEIIDRKIINKPYYAGYPLRSSTSVRSLYILIFTVKDSCGNEYKVKVAQSSFYNEINCDPYWNEINWIGKKANWKVKKYPGADIYVFIDNL